MRVVLCDRGVFDIVKVELLLVNCIVDCGVILFSVCC